MMKFLVTLSCLIAIIAASISLGCGKTEDAINQTTIPTALSEQTLVQIWDKVLEITDVQAQTVNLHGFSFVADKTNILTLLFQFYGIDAQGKTKYYQAELESEGELISFFHDADTDASYVLQGNNPLRYFEELDKLGFSGMNTEDGDAGFSIRLDFQGGSWGVSHENIDISQLKDGKVTPLNKLLFYTNAPIGRISFSIITPAWGRTITDGNYRSQKPEVWFITDDMDKATTVEYL